MMDGRIKSGHDTASVSTKPSIDALKSLGQHGCK
jgi:hypothetical protein